MAAPPATSGIDDIFDVTTGVPQAMASTIGIPNPSDREGKRKSLLIEYRQGRAARIFDGDHVLHSEVARDGRSAGTCGKPGQLFEERWKGLRKADAPFDRTGKGMKEGTKEGGIARLTPEGVEDDGKTGDEVK